MRAIAAAVIDITAVIGTAGGTGAYASGRAAGAIRHLFNAIRLADNTAAAANSAVCGGVRFRGGTKRITYGRAAVIFADHCPGFGPIAASRNTAGNVTGTIGTNGPGISCCWRAGSRTIS